VWAKRLYDSRANGDVGDKMSIHDIDMNPVTSGGINGPHFFSQSGKVSGQNRWRNAYWAGHIFRLDVGLRMGKRADGVMHSLSHALARLTAVNKQVTDDIM
jgi:hypothetical protein